MHDEDMPSSLNGGYFYNPGDSESDRVALTHITSSGAAGLLLPDPSNQVLDEARSGSDAFGDPYSQPPLHGAGPGADEDEDVYIPTGEEVTGRWTKEEHELFLLALKKYGKVKRMNKNSKNVMF